MKKVLLALAIVLVAATFLVSGTLSADCFNCRWVNLAEDGEPPDMVPLCWADGSSGWWTCADSGLLSTIVNGCWTEHFCWQTDGGFPQI